MNERGFTVPELLVTMGIAAALATLLLPVFKGVGESVREAKCLNNVRQIGVAALRACADDGGRVIGWYNHTTNRYWYEALQSYLGAPGGIRTVFKCPSDPYFDPANVAQTISYAWNYNVLGGGGSGTAGNESPRLLPIATYKKPSQTLMMTDSSRTDSWGYIDTWGHTPDPLRHRGRTSAFFLDGHATRLDVKTLQSAKPYMDRDSVINES